VAVRYGIKSIPTTILVDKAGKIRYKSLRGKQLESAVQQIWGGRAAVPRTWRAFVRVRLISFGFILAIGFLLLVSLTLTTALAALRGHVVRHFEGLVGMFASLDFLLSIGLGTGLVALIYRYLPAHRLPWRQVLTGALVTALLFHRDVGRSGFISGARRSRRHMARRRHSPRCSCGCITRHRSSCLAPNSPPASGGRAKTSAAGGYYLLIVNLPKATPRSQPSPLPLSARETSPLVTTPASDDFTAPACAPALT
jgi:hypothetical protein